VLDRARLSPQGDLPYADMVALFWLQFCQPGDTGDQLQLIEPFVHL
jgi:hypothetical protein